MSARFKVLLKKPLVRRNVDGRIVQNDLAVNTRAEGGRTIIAAKQRAGKYFAKRVWPWIFDREVKTELKVRRVRGKLEGTTAVAVGTREKNLREKIFGMGPEVETKFNLNRLDRGEDQIEVVKGDDGEKEFVVNYEGDGALIITPLSKTRIRVKIS